MSKVLTFSRTYPSYHPRAGEPTYFVEKIWDATSLPCVDDLHCLSDEKINFMRRGSDLIWPKYHTIRSGHRFKPGDKFSPRVWSGKPYHSKQIIIASDIEVVRTWDFVIQNRDIFVDKQIVFDSDAQFFENSKILNAIALCDGLTLVDFLAWFKYPTDFDGQITCWSDTVNY